MTNNQRFVPENSNGTWPEATQVPAWGSPGWQGSWPSASAPRGPIIPFRPLSVGDLFNGTFAAIRWNPKVVFTFSLVTMSIVGLLMGIFNAVTMLSHPEVEVLYSPYGVDFSEVLNPASSDYVATTFTQSLLGIVQAGATVLISGMLVLSVTGAVVGAKKDVGQTWRELSPRFWPLVGTTILYALITGGIALAGTALIAALILLFSSAGIVFGVLLGIILGLAVVGTIVWVSVRLFMAPMITVVERVSPTRAIARSWQVTEGAFWRCLGRLLLLGLVVGAATAILGGAISALVFVVFGFAAPWLSALVGTLAFAALSGLTQPVSASFTALMYVDERIRKEGLASSLEAALAANEGGFAGQLA